MKRFHALTCLTLAVCLAGSAPCAFAMKLMNESDNQIGIMVVIREPSRDAPIFVKILNAKDSHDLAIIETGPFVVEVKDLTTQIEVELADVAPKDTVIYDGKELKKAAPVSEAQEPAAPEQGA